MGAMKSQQTIETQWILSTLSLTMLSHKKIEYLPQEAGVCP